ncbi:MAG: anti-sigma factor family protein [Pseudonocardiaceae bacterium]
MDRHESMLIAFLAGDLNTDASREWDEHLLGCEGCWQAVREDRLGRAAAARLRESAPPELAERVAFAVELAGAPVRRRRPRRWVFAAGGLLVAAVSAVIVGLFPTATADPPEIAAVVAFARDMPATAHGIASDAPVPMGTPVAVDVGGAHVQLRYYRVGTVPAVVAVSDRPFPMPAGVGMLPSGAMAWTVTRAGVRLYCANSNVVIAAPVTVGELPGLASRLPMP